MSRMRLHSFKRGLCCVLAGAAIMSLSRAAHSDSVSYTSSASGYVSVNIYDSTGAVVRELKRREWQASGTHKLYWDHKDNNGVTLPAGTYTYKMLSNPSTLKAQYLMSIGSSYPMGDQRNYMGPGTHQTPGAVAVDSTGMYVAARTTENIETMLLKQPISGTSRTWSSVVPPNRPWDGAVAMASANGTLFMLGNYASNSAQDPAHPDNPLRAQWIYKYQPSPSGTTGLFADGSTDPAAAANHIDVSWDNPTLYNADATDMDADGTTLVVAYKGKNAIRWYDETSGALLDTATVTAPAGVTVGAGGTVYVTSGTGVYSLTSAAHTLVPIVSTGLTAPTLIDYDTATPASPLLVYDAGTFQVKRCSSAGVDAAYPSTPGERPVGLYAGTQTRFTHVVDLAADLAGGFFVTEMNAAPRRVARFNSSGALVKEWYGGQKWAPCTMVDPSDQTSVWMQSETEDALGNGYDYMHLTVDVNAKTWSVQGIYKWKGLASGLVTWGDNYGADTYEILNHNGKTYIVKNGYTFTVAQIDTVNNKFRPVTVCGAIGNLPAGTAATTLIQGGAGGNQSYQWNDTNGDGDVQIGEVTYYAGVFTGGSGVEIPDADINGDYYCLQQGSASTDGTMIKYPATWSGDIPVYAMPGGTAVFTTPTRMRGTWDSRWSGFTYHDRATDNVYVGMNAGINGAIGECLDPFLYKWNHGATGSWQVGGKAPASGPMPPGLIRGGTRRFTGMTTQNKSGGGTVSSVMLQDYQGAADGYDPTQAAALTYVWDADGLWVGSVFDSVDTSSPWYMYVGSGEFLQGQLYTDAGKNVYFYGNWENETRVWKITGWNNWIKLGGTVSAGGTLTQTMTVSYGSVAISNGDTSPSTTKGTDFGSVNQGSGLSHNFTIKNTGTGDLNLTTTTPVTFSGTYGGDFVSTAAPVNIPPSGTATLTLRFIPTAVGLRGGASPNLSKVVISNNTSGTNPFTFALKGTGLADSTVSNYVVTVSGATNIRSTPNTSGMSFLVGSHALSVTALGRYVLAGDQYSHPLFLVDAATGQLVPGSTATVQTKSVTANTYSYASLAAPITLQANKLYYVVSSETTNDPWCDPNPTTLSVTSVATLSGAINGNTSNPYTHSWANAAWHSYGPLDFQYKVLP